MELEFYGAAGRVTGSCHILRVGEYRVLLDCGMIQGSRAEEALNKEPFPFEPDSIDAVILSHAHIDHSGRLPLLVKRGFRGPIFTHNASKELCGILLQDSAGLAERDAEYLNRRRRDDEPAAEPLYTRADARATLSQLRGVRYRKRHQITPGIEVTFRDAGHILGSAAVEIWLQEAGVERKLVFSGDLGQYDTPILNDPEALAAADLIVMESTYGNRLHRDRAATATELGDIISTASAQNGNVLIPAFALGRSQELLYQFGKHYSDWGMDRWRVFLDSPMAIEASHVYWEYPHLYDDEATHLRRHVDELPPLGNLHLTASVEESMVINRMKSGAIVIAGSGMCNGGRILHHFKHNISRPESHVVFVGYQANGSLGRRLVDGADSIKIYGKHYPVKAKIHTVGGLSAHGDQDDLFRWVSSFKPHPPIYLVHGEPRSAGGFAEHLQAAGYSATVATPGARINLLSSPGVMQTQ